VTNHRTINSLYRWQII